MLKLSGKDDDVAARRPAPFAQRPGAPLESGPRPLQSCIITTAGNGPAPSGLQKWSRGSIGAEGDRFGWRLRWRRAPARKAGYAIAARAIRRRVSRISSPRTSRSAYSAKSSATSLRQYRSMSVLSMGLARLATSSRPAAITSSVSFLPFRNSPAFSTRNGRDATAPSAIRASVTIFPSNFSAAATPRIGKSNEPRRRSFQ